MMMMMMKKMMMLMIIMMTMTMMMMIMMLMMMTMIKMMLELSHEDPCWLKMCTACELSNSLLKTSKLSLRGFVFPLKYISSELGFKIFFVESLKYYFYQRKDTPNL